MIVYCATCPTGRKYIGITTRTLESRRRQHELACEQGSELKFHCALRKYRTSMHWCVLDTARDTEALREKERHWIAVLDTQHNGYNSTAGGEAFCHVKDTYREDGVLVTVYAASEAGRNEGRNAKVLLIDDDVCKRTPPIDLDQVARMDRAESRRQERKGQRAARKQILDLAPDEQAAVRAERRIAKAEKRAAQADERTKSWRRA